MVEDIEFDMPEPKKLALAGDWHGNFGWAELAMNYAVEQGCDVLLQVGDFGYWPSYEESTGSQTGGSHFLFKVTEKAKELGLMIYWIDGNHENHEHLHPGMGHDGVIRHLPRGHRWHWWGKSWMAVGGAVSIDKQWRTAGHDWFPQETLVQDQIHYASREGGVDIIVSHDCPAGVVIPGIQAENEKGFWPSEQIAESEAHRRLLRQIVDATGAKLIVHGHYHRRYNTISEDHKLSIIGLDCDATGFKENMLLMTPQAVLW
jgi:predicted phosphodiesterase